MKDIFSEIQSLNLSLEKYALIGGGALSVYGIRDYSDVDLVVTPDIYEEFKKKEGWIEKCKECPKSTFLVLEKDNFEMYTLEGFNSKDFNTAVNYIGDYRVIIASAEIVKSVSVASLSEVRRFKEAYGRPKDIQDIRLIDEYLLSVDQIK